MFDTKVIKDVVFVAGQTLSNDVEILRQIVQPSTASCTLRTLAR